MYSNVCWSRRKKYYSNTSQPGYGIAAATDQWLFQSDVGQKHQLKLAWYGLETIIETKAPVKTSEHQMVTTCKNGCLIAVAISSNGSQACRCP